MWIQFYRLFEWTAFHDALVTMKDITLRYCVILQ